MVRSILFPKPLNMKFYSDAIKFVLVLALLGEELIVVMNCCSVWRQVFTCTVYRIV